MSHTDDHDGPTAPRTLPPGFTFGASTSAFQIEGATTLDGRGPSIWDAFCRRPGAVTGGDTADRACEHYVRYREDVALAADLGVDTYRFSVSWPRVMPDGLTVNPKGLAFYDRLVDGLLAREITPFACLFHWDLPQAVYERGGWGDRDTALRFAEYAGIVADRLGDRVGMWATMNEPWVHLLRGHIIGDHAPGEHLMDWGPIVHGLLLAHGGATSALRASGVRGAVGLIESVAPVRPLSESPQDVGIAQMFDAIRNRLFLSAVLHGRHEDAVVRMMPSLIDCAQAQDMTTIAGELDFLGINYYQPVGIRAAAPGGPVPFEFGPVPGLGTTAAGFMIDPDGLRESLVELGARHRDRLPPIYVTEIGCACTDELDEAGRCDDRARIDYIGDHLRAIGGALDEGVDVRGCLVWSLLDNFEWDQGLGSRYGLVHVDFRTQRRTPKASFHWYAGLIARHRRSATPA